MIELIKWGSGTVGRESKKGEVNRGQNNGSCLGRLRNPRGIILILVIENEFSLKDKNASTMPCVILLRLCCLPQLWITE